MKYFATKLSDNIGETREGFLICLNVPIGRTGDMEYGRGETPIEVGDDGIALISRDEDEIFSEKTIASFQGKPVTIRHPEDFVDPRNWKQLAVGLLQNVRRGDGEFKDSLVSDLLITDAFAISLVKNGLREVSCGYECEYTQSGVGKGKQTNIVGNHLALVEQGRAGSEYAVRDHKGVSQMDKSLLDRIKKILKGKTVDEANFDKAVKDAESNPDQGSPAVMDEKMYDELVKMCKDLGEKIDSLGKGKDEEEEKEKPKDEESDKKDKKDGEDEGEESSMEERMKKLEVAVSKLLEKGADEDKEESEDDDSEIIEDDDKEESEDESEEESEDEEAEMTGDVKSRAEILAPGIKITKDVKRAALKTAFATKDGKEAIVMLTGGKKPAFEKMTEDQVEVLFVGTSEMLKSKRSGELARSKRGHVTGDGFQSSIFEQDGVMTPEKMNDLNKKRYNLK